MISRAARAITWTFALCSFVATVGCHSTDRCNPTCCPNTIAEKVAPEFEAEIKAFEAADRAHPPVSGQVLFVGSSSFRMWSSLATDMGDVPTVNRAFGGSRTADVLAAFDRIVAPQQPAVIVYYCGDNDLGEHNTDAQAAADGFIAFHRRATARWPNVQVLYVAIKPSLARWSNWDAMRKANGLVRAYCDRTAGATFVDIIPVTLAPDGRPNPALFKADGLHLNAEGYRAWTGVIRPAVDSAWMWAHAPQ